MKYDKRLTAAVLAGVLTLGANAAIGQDWIEGAFDDRCDAEATGSMSGAIRANIEEQVSRGEASIRPPAAIGDLGCLNDLMSAPIDVFSNVGSMMGDLLGGLGGAAGSIDLGNGVSRQICQFAAEKWGEVTQPIGALNNLQLPDLSTAFSQIGDPFSGSTGSPSAPANPDPAAPGGAADPTGDPGQIYVDQAAYDQAYAEHQQLQQQIISEHQACEVARATYQPYSGEGWGSSSPPTAAQCQSILGGLGAPEPDISDYIYQEAAAVPATYSAPAAPMSVQSAPRTGTEDTGSVNGDILDQIWGTMGR